MGETLAQKIIRAHLLHGDMTPGSEIALRIDQTLLDKLGYIAEYEGRTKNRELEQMIKKRIRDFEQEHGEITLE